MARDETGGDESGDAEIAAAKSPVYRFWLVHHRLIDCAKNSMLSTVKVKSQ